MAGEPLLRRSLGSIVTAGVRDVTIVTGYRGELIRTAVETWFPVIAARFVEAPDYDRNGSMGSLLAAVQATGPAAALLFESDLLYDASFIATALTCRRSTLLTADVSGSGDEVYVCRSGAGDLTFLGKLPPPEIRAAAVGEFAGISRLDEATLGRFADRAGNWLARGRTGRHYEDVLLDLAIGGHAIAVRHCPGLAWTEIDTPADLERAARTVLPRLLGGAVPARRPPLTDRDHLRPVACP